jgi:sensor histidine kinase YesM
MSWHDLVFSNQARYRTRRHLLCWLFWWLYVVFTIFYASKIPGGFFHYQPGLNEIGLVSYILLVTVKSVLLLLCHLFFCYAVLYVLLTHFLSKQNYWHLVSGLLLLCSLLIPVGYLLYTVVYPSVDRLFSLHVAPSKSVVWASVDATLINAVKVSLVAVAITLLKHWWVRQKEKEQLEKERINAEVQLLKAQIHPEFLFSTLNNIAAEARSGSPKAPEMLIKLSDLLSYMLYECDAPKVKVEREIMMLREYIALERLRRGERLELTFKVNGNVNGQLISPLLLLPFIDHIFSGSSDEVVEQLWVNIDITVQDNHLTMKIINGIPLGTDESAGRAMVKIQKRLSLLYPARHELKMNAVQELFLIHLNLELADPACEKQTLTAPGTQLFSYA